jgi:hypothetical protein
MTPDLAITRDAERAARNEALSGPGDHHVPGWPQCNCQQCADDAWGGE